MALGITWHTWGLCEVLKPGVGKSRYIGERVGAWPLAPGPFLLTLGRVVATKSADTTSTASASLGWQSWRVHRAFGVLRRLRGLEFLSQEMCRW